MWGNSGFGTLVYSLNPNHPDETIQPLKKVKMGSVGKIHKALYPTNRWRDYHDFDKVVVNSNEECWVAPDGVTIIPVCYDLARSSGLAEAIPGKPLYVSNEYDKRTVKLDVDDQGNVSNMQRFAEKGEFFSIPEKNGDVYIADGDIYVFNSAGKQKGMIHIPERPNSIAFGGKDKDSLFVTGREAFYSASYIPKHAFKVLAVASADPDHDPMIIKSKAWLEKIAAENNFEIVVTRDASLINDTNLAKYQVFVQLHLAPFDMTGPQQEALQKFIISGKGWVGVHAAGLTGTQFKGPDVPYWKWFEKLMGGIIYSPHPEKQTGTILVEDRTHPVTKNLPPSFRFYDEWYEFNKSPRPNVHVLATADEKSYKPEIPMGDHPMIWITPEFERAVYIGIGHDTTACNDPNFTILMRDAILWAASPVKKPDFKALVLTERGGQHESFAKAALEWLDKYASDSNIELTVINNTEIIDEGYLSDFRVFIQLDYPPYTWPEKAMSAFVKYIEEGRGGWVGFHHATLLGEFDGYPMWNWFSDFMGGIRFDNYIAAKASGKVVVEDLKHPVMKGVAGSFVLDNDEWYTYNKSPRPNVHVLATVDESSYNPPSDIKMGDHPVVWVNPKMKARNVYFLMGHDGSLLQSKDFTRMFSNAIQWTSGE
jgi:type 1 glutamine amidotransferase